VSAEELKISGDVLVTKIKELIAQGNVRRIIIKNEEKHTSIEIPMTVRCYRCDGRALDNCD
jgi:hypothetical protein